MLVKLTSLLWLNTHLKDFPCAGATFLSNFSTLNGFSTVSRPLRLAEITVIIARHGPRILLSSAHLNSPVFRMGWEWTRPTGPASELRPTTTTFQMLLGPEPPKAMRVKHSWLKLIRAQFISPFQKQQQQQQSNDCTYYRRRNRRTHCAVYSVLWRSLAVASSADWTQPRYGYLSRARFEFDSQPHRRHLRRPVGASRTTDDS